MLITNTRGIDLNRDDIVIIYCVKDARSFATSNISKHDNKATMKARWQSLNYWYSVNNSIYQYLESDAVNSYHLCLYETFCSKPKQLIQDLINGGVSIDSSLKNRNLSHIAMGNKGFINQKGFEIRYDDRWRNDQSLKLLFKVHKSAHKLNKTFYQCVRQ